MHGKTETEECNTKSKNSGNKEMGSNSGCTSFNNRVIKCFNCIIRKLYILGIAIKNFKHQTFDINFETLNFYECPLSCIF